MNDAEIIEHVQRHWIYVRKSRTNLPLARLLAGYRAMKKDGKSDSDIVTYWSSKAVGMNRTDAGTFVSAMKMIQKDGGIQDPNERPSWQESYDESGLPGSKTSAFPWGKVTAIGAVALFVVWGLPNLVKATRDSGHHKKEIP